MITPPCWGAQRYTHSTYIRSVSLFAAGSIVSAGIVGGICGGIGVLLMSRAPMLRPVLWGLIMVVAALYGVAELRGEPAPVPTRHWLVPRNWGRFGKARYALAFGLLLGAGFFTLVTFVGYYLILGTCVAIADPIYGVALMAIFGAIRAAPVALAPLIYWVRGRRYSFELAAEVNDWLMRIELRIPTLRTITLFSVAGSALALMSSR